MIRCRPAAFVLLSLLTVATLRAGPALTSYVDMHMGVQGSSGGVIGPQVPHGSVNPSPQTPHGGNGGYKPGEPVRGFGQLQVTGTGWGKYGQVFLSPQVGLRVGEADHDSPISDEIATPSYYSVVLDRYHVRVELTPTAHAVIYRFTFPQTSDAHLLLDVTHSIPEDIAPIIKGRFLGGAITVGADHGRPTFSGWGRYAGGFGGSAPYAVYFYAVVSQAPSGFGVWRSGRIRAGTRSVRGRGRIGAYLAFTTTPARPVYLKVGVSMKSVANARRFAEREIRGFDFASVRRAGEARWEDVLRRITLQGATATQRRIFYTCLYQSFLMPRDRTGDNPKWDSPLPYWDDQYATWDTWRTKFPLMTLIAPAVTRDNILSYINRLEHNGELGDAFVAGNDGEKQGGDDVDEVIADACLKGLPGVDWNRAFAVLRHDAGKQRYPQYLKRGWIPSGPHDRMSCSDTLECAANDYSDALVARRLGHRRLSERWLHRARQWQHLWNPAVRSDGFAGFIEPRRADGTWVRFDPKQYPGSWKPFFYEANSWTYSFFVPQDIATLIRLCGGRKRFVERLDHAFSHHLMELDNEPSFLATREFNYAGRPDRTAYWVHRIMTRGYSLTQGYPGNEDSGAVASWYVFSALGFFPNAGQDVYLINGPFCPKLTVTLGNGRHLIVEADGVSDRNIYVQSVTLNGRAWDRDWFRQADIADGGVLRFVMGPRPSSWARQAPPPPSLSDRD